MLEHRTEKLYVAALGLFGLLIGSRPIGDNSLLTHLRTGMTIAAGRGIPRRDTYSFTALHHPWVVQSWLPEASYGLLQRAGGLRLVVLEQALLSAALALTIAWLARTGTAATTAFAGVLAVFTGAGYWAPRPLLFGLLCLALTIAITEGSVSPWWLVPVVWVWVNSHGSFPLGLLWVVLTVVGEAFDGLGTVSKRRLKCLGAFLVGLTASAVNPLGPRLLLFPLKVQQKQAVFKAIIEWRSPNFQSGPGLIALCGIAAVLVILVRRRISWTYALPSAAFLAAGLFAARNLAAAAIVFAPALGQALRGGVGVPLRRRSRVGAPGQPVDGAGRVGGGVGAPGRGINLDAVFAALMAAVAVVAIAVVLSRPATSLDGFPVAATTWIDQAGLRAEPHRIIEPDVAGNYLEYRFGTDASVFIDDRYDMYPTSVAQDYQTMFFVRSGALDVLDRYKADVVLWQEHQPFVTLLQATGRWREAFHGGGWVVLLRR